MYLDAVDSITKVFKNTDKEKRNSFPA